eukprot:TRINITY_DN9190_c0_g1_i5.p1 TRINITY_DN9190_c0_g1~~TRINITY_DN9190_c0_g1_i5.p1  ORF type:complete len:124 (-),score=18.67 TRINITY_DN9190_c0_g1_i5:999-1370(-)
MLGESDAKGAAAAAAAAPAAAPARRTRSSGTLQAPTPDRHSEDRSQLDHVLKQGARAKVWKLFKVCSNNRMPRSPYVTTAKPRRPPSKATGMANHLNTRLTRSQGDRGPGMSSTTRRPIENNF